MRTLQQTHHNQGSRNPNKCITQPYQELLKTPKQIHHNQEKSQTNYTINPVILEISREDTQNTHYYQGKMPQQAHHKP